MGILKLTQFNFCSGITYRSIVGSYTANFPPIIANCLDPCSSVPLFPVNPQILSLTIDTLMWVNPTKNH